MGDRAGTGLNASGRLGMLQQLAISQTMALQRVLEWMLEQPGANRRMLDGVTGFLATAHLALRYFGDSAERAALVRSIEATSNDMVGRLRLLPEPDAVLH